MAKGFFTLRTVGIGAAAISVALLAVVAYGVSAPGDAVQKAPDVLYIDGLKAFGNLERLPVPFMHDKHTTALSKEGKDCSACHLKRKDGKRSLKFKRLSDASKDQVMETYHLACIRCHEQALSDGKASGPITCGQCHTGDEKVASSRVLPDFDKSLHARHASAYDNKCDSCHHSYDEKAQKKVYLKGEEASCRYCHGQTSVDNRMDYRSAAHTQCIACHEMKLEQKQQSGPADCAGCHAQAKLAQVKKLKEIPRLERSQPDAAFVKNGSAAGEGGQRMKLVPFDHKAHESYTDSCRVCHHAALSSCAQCHSVQGKKEGGHINLERAMHGLGNDQSCLGCHVTRQKQADCAGCHQRSSGAFEQPESCAQCHQAESPPQDADKEMLNQAASQALAAAKREVRVVPDGDIPEVVKIGVLSKKFEPAEFPHRKIVKHIAEDLAQSPLAAAFHKDALTMCTGCHHNSPASLKPPQCASCHGEPFNPKKMSMPGLKAAYHQQCMNCHSAMQLDKPQATACAECHKKKD